MTLHIAPITHPDLHSEDLMEEFIFDMFGIQGGMFTELSEVSDFCGSGLTPEQDEQINRADSYRSVCTLWDRFIIEKIYKAYGVHLESTRVLLTDMVARIQSPPSIQ